MAQPLSSSDIPPHPQKQPSPRPGETPPRARSSFDPGAFEAVFSELLEDAVRQGATDVHVRAGDVVYARIDGALIPLATALLTPNDTRTLGLRVLEANGSTLQIDEIKEYEGPWSVRGVGRFRVNILRQRSSFMVVLRVISDILPTFDQLNLPRAVVQATRTDAGLIIVCGAPESGRATTIAALVNFMNTTAVQRRHCVLLEGPIEFLHRSQHWSMTQREVGSDTDSFADGVKSAIMQDADVIVIGALEDPPVIEAAVRAAEGGRLVIARVQAPDATAAVHLMLQGMDGDDMAASRLRLVEVLHTIIGQKLIPRQAGGRRALATQLLLMTPYVREALLETGSLETLTDALRKGRDQFGTQTHDQSLADLVLSGEVSFEMAVKLATNPLDLELQLRGSR
jgi:twitching motility protein PilT